MSVKRMRCRLSIHRNIRISRMHRGHSPSKKTSTCHFIEGFDILALVRQENEMLVSVMSHHHATDCRSESILTTHRLGKQLHYQKSIASSRATTNRMWYTSSLVMTARWVISNNRRRTSPVYQISDQQTRKQQTERGDDDGLQSGNQPGNISATFSTVGQGRSNMPSLTQVEPVHRLNLSPN